MEIPKNITQIGEWSTCDRIYVEDYVVSYLKQMRVAAKEKELAIALYGLRSKEDGRDCFFVYGAGKLTFLQKETRHLSQAQKQEIEKIRVKYFGDFVFLGYGVLNGEMVEGFYISDQEICRYVSGYAQFYEKNDPMLAYMLDEREEDAPSEVVSLDKYQAVRQKQEQRRQENDEKANKKPHNPDEESLLQSRIKTRTSKEKTERKIYKKSIAFMGGIGAVYLLYISGGLNLDGVARALGERQLPVNSKKVEMEYTEVVQNQNETMPEDNAEYGPENKDREEVRNANGESVGDGEGQAGVEGNQDEINIGQADGEGIQSEIGIDLVDGEGGKNEIGDGQATSEKSERDYERMNESGGAKNAMQVYIIQKGDTLSGISFFTYGTDRRVGDICKINNILNPDEIKIGQKIFLP